MQRANDWDTTRAAMSGETERLSLGGHVCKILHAKVEDRNGHEALVLSFDIDEGTEYDGIMRRKFDGIKARSDGMHVPQWPIDGTFSQFTRDYKDQTKTNPFFKGLIQAVCDSNPGYQWDWNERSLNGKYIGLVFGEEEYPARDTGEIRTSVRARFCCAAADAPDKEPPKRKEYNGARPQTSSAAATTGGGFTQVDDDELPF